MSEAFKLGLEVCAENPPAVLRGARFGLVMNQASVDHDFVTADDVLIDALPDQLAALFGPQHGLWSEQQDNMIETPHGLDPDRGIPVHSLYADVRKPTAAMLDGLDALVVDLQDVGTRIYTYVWTLLHCLEAAAEEGVKVVVLDRPNPLGGEVIEGPLLDPDYQSFVGLASIPMRHGLTLGELAQLLNSERQIGADLHVVAMHGWSRSNLWFDLGRAWIPPSPNLPRYEGVLLYPGQVLLEGTTLSEGRGTTTPFEVCGAPGIDPHALSDALEDYDLDGFVARPYRFEPTFQKHAGASCGGIYLHPINAYTLRSYRMTAALLACVKAVAPDAFGWRQPPYEYEHDKMPIDILSGSPALRKAIDAGLTRDTLATVTAVDDATWWARAEPFLLYS